MWQLLNRTRSVSKSKERGASLILFTFLTVMVIIPMIGLAIDCSLQFWAKAKLSAALDAAVLAAGRNPAVDPTATAVQYVEANLPPGWMGTSYSSGPTATVDFPQASTRRVTITAAVTVPTIFMRLLGQNNSLVAATAASSRRDANIILVLDRSSSMNITGPDGANVCDTMKASAQTFVNYFIDGRDQLELVTFTAGANVDFAFSKSFQSSNPNMNFYINQLVCASNTSSAMALNLAYAELQKLGASAYSSNGVLNVIVFFTDGQPNGITADFTVRTQNANESRYDPSSTGTLRSPLALGPTPLLCVADTLLNNPTNYLTGVIAQWAGGAVPTGTTEGLMQTTVPMTTCGGHSSAICNGASPLIPAPGCMFDTQGDGKYMRQDLAFIPLTDHYQNSTNNAAYMTQPSDWVTTGPYSTGCLGVGNSCGFRTDVPQALVDAAFNAADAQAQKIIHDTNYKPVIYALGLGGARDAPTEDVFQRFLRRVSNDPNSDIYDPSGSQGMFVYSPDDTQLAAAFRTIASQILRLSK